MPWNLDSDRPIYLQLMERIQHDIISGTYRPGDKLPSVRELAMEASVNPNTMQKALAELESTGLIYSNRTSGRFVTDNEELIHENKKNLAKDYCNDFFIKLKSLGITQAEILELISECMNE